jgi:hypothetical protein
MGPTIVCGVVIKAQSSDGLIQSGPGVCVGDYRLFILESIGPRWIATETEHKPIEGIESVEGAWFPTSFVRLVSPPIPLMIRMFERWHPALLETDEDRLNTGID